MRVLVTGGAGYVGSVLVPMLLDRGYDVRVVDAGWFGTAHVRPECEFVEGDVLDVRNEWFDAVDAVIHLAGLSNDPMAAFSPSLNYMLNAAGPAVVAHFAKQAGIARFVFASSCSVYGLNDAAEIDESHEPMPTFPYAISKLMGERALGCLTDADFRPIVLRFGTVVGWSPRMRFDLVTNTMIKTAVSEGRIIVHNPSLWRPLIDTRDVASVFLRALDADLSVVGTFNVATENYTIGRVGDVVAETLREFGVSVPLDLQRRADVRSYRVSMERAARVLDFHPRVSMADTVRAIMPHVLSGELGDLDDIRYHNVAQMRARIADGCVPWVPVDHTQGGRSSSAPGGSSSLSR